MTIKELCNKTLCHECSFNAICWDLCEDPITELDDEHITRYTKAIIETARMLQNDIKSIIATDISFQEDEND